MKESDIFGKYRDLFDDKLGHLEGDVHLEVDLIRRPVQMPLRRMPIALKDQVETDLKKDDRRRRN